VDGALLSAADYGDDTSLQRRLAFNGGSYWDHWEVFSSSFSIKNKDYLFTLFLICH
jgi:hypothetical protein